MWKDEGCGAVFKLNQVHDAVEVAYLAQYPWPFAKTGLSFTVADRFKQSAIPSHNRPILPVFCR